MLATRKGTPLSPGGLYERVLVPLGIPGFHSARRWRVSVLKKARSPESLVKAWIGHAPGNQSWESDNRGNDITALYDKSGEDKDWRRDVVNRVGIGFELPDLNVGHPAPTPGSWSRATSAPQTISASTESAEPATPAAPTYAAVDTDLADFFYSTPEQKETEA